MNRILIASSAALLMFLSTSLSSPSEARGFKAAGPRGGAGGFARQGQYGSSAGVGGFAYGRGAAGAVGRRFNGPNGGSWAGAHGGVVTPTAGLVGGGFKGSGPNGGTAQGAGAAGWKQGVGGFENTKMSATGPGGSTYNGFTNGKYNAQTGQGNFNSSHQAYDAKNGQNYGYTNDTNYTKGQGGQTQIDTNNKGDYTVDWGGGQKTSVVKDPAQ